MIHKQLISLDAPQENRESIFNWVSQVALREAFINNEEKFTEALFNREKEFPTAIGYDVAIPHCRSSAVLKPFVAFIHTHKLINWDIQTDEKVELIFLIAIPEENEGNLHLKVLSSISRKLMHDDFREELKSTSSIDEVYELLSKINNEIEKGE